MMQMSKEEQSKELLRLSILKAGEEIQELLKASMDYPIDPNKDLEEQLGRFEMMESLVQNRPRAKQPVPASSTQSTVQKHQSQSR
jgi:hypothetical protein